MRIRFYLTRPQPGKKAIQNAKESGKPLPEFDPSTPTAIFALINYDGQSVKVYTDESVPPAFWSAESNRVRSTREFPQHLEVNQRLNNIRSTITKVFLDHKNDNGHDTPSPDILKNLIDVSLKRNVKKITFLEYFQDFVDRSFDGKRTYKKNSLTYPVSKGVAKGFQTTLEHLTNYNRLKKKLFWENIDLNFHADFTRYLEQEVLLSANTIGSIIKRIKTVMQESLDRGIHKNLAFKNTKFYKQSEINPEIYLTEFELTEFRTLDLSGNERLCNVRDAFVIACRTGLRFGDLSALKSEYIINDRIRIKQSKTKNIVVIPLHPDVREILARRNGELPYCISNVNMNAYLKEVAKKVKCLHVDFTTEITKGGFRKIEAKPRYKLLKVHSARRTFCTLSYLSGINPITIMAISGHKGMADFLRYVRATSEEHADKMAEAWKEIEFKNKLSVVA